MSNYPLKLKINKSRQLTAFVISDQCVDIAKYMYKLLKYKTKYQEEVAKIESMLFQALAGYTLTKSEKTYHTKRRLRRIKETTSLKASLRVV